MSFSALATARPAKAGRALLALEAMLAEPLGSRSAGFRVSASWHTQLQCRNSTPCKQGTRGLLSRPDFGCRTSYPEGPGVCSLDAVAVCAARIARRRARIFHRPAPPQVRALIPTANIASKSPMVRARIPSSAVTTIAPAAKPWPNVIEDRLLSEIFDLKLFTVRHF